jgi:hypothetical protein
MGVPDRLVGNRHSPELVLCASNPRRSCGKCVTQQVSEASGFCTDRFMLFPAHRAVPRLRDSMKYKNELSSCVWRTVASGLLLFVTAIPLNQATAQSLHLCSWPFEVTGHGITNVATPDTNATYWVMPLDTNLWNRVIIEGQYPEARFFNFTIYQETGSLVDTILDASIAPDSGSVNPFAVKVGDGHPNTYTIQVGRNIGGSGNSLLLGASRLEFLVYRVYAPDSTFDRMGGGGVPTITLVGPNGSILKLQPCPFADTESNLINTITLLRMNGFTDAVNFLQQILMTAGVGTGSCTSGQPAPATTVNFEIASLGADFFPNPQTTYLETPGLCFQAGKVLVVKGRAPVFPNTYNGESVFDPAPPFDQGSNIQLRYWSMCNNNREPPFSVIACQADFATTIEKISDHNHRYTYTYTYIVSADLAPPPWLPANATWLPWGPIDIPKNLIFRALLSENSFALTRDYYPRAVFCDLAVLQACLAAAAPQM